MVGDEPDGICIHILRHGFPLCGFSDDVPVNWPEGHLWLGLDDDHAGRPMCVDCVLIKNGYRQRCHWLGLVEVVQHVGSGLCFVRLPGLVFAWAPRRWWHLGLVRFWRWEFEP
jgi:hypothetical protein